jgi:hypothetical protein
LRLHHCEPGDDRISFPQGMTGRRMDGTMKSGEWGLRWRAAGQARNGLWRIARHVRRRRRIVTNGSASTAGLPPGRFASSATTTRAELRPRPGRLVTTNSSDLRQVAAISIDQQASR